MIADIKEYRYFSQSDDSGSLISYPFSIKGRVYALLECGEIHVLDRPNDNNNAFSCLANVYPEGVDFFMRSGDGNGILIAGGRVWSPDCEIVELFDSSLEPIPLPCCFLGGLFIVRMPPHDSVEGVTMLIDISSDKESYRVVYEDKILVGIPDSPFFYAGDEGPYTLFMVDDSSKDVLKVAQLDIKPTYKWGVFEGDGKVFFVSPDGNGSVYDEFGNRKSLNLEDIFHSLGVSSIRRMRYHNKRFVFTYHSSLARQHLMAVIDPDGLQVVWQSDIPKRSSSYLDFVVVKEFAFVLHDSAVSMIDLSDGSILWKSINRDFYLDECRKISDDMICFWSQSASRLGVFLDLSAL